MVDVNRFATHVSAAGLLHAAAKAQKATHKDEHKRGLSCQGIRRRATMTGKENFKLKTMLCGHWSTAALVSCDAGPACDCAEASESWARSIPDCHDFPASTDECWHSCRCSCLLPSLRASPLPAYPFDIRSKGWLQAGPAGTMAKVAFCY